MMKCYWRQTHDLSTTKEMRIALSSNMDCYSGNSAEKLIASNPSKFVIQKQLVSEVIRSLHGDFGKHPGTTKTKNAYGEKYYYPNMGQLISEWDIFCEQGIRESRINRGLTHFPRQNPNEQMTARRRHAN